MLNIFLLAMLAPNQPPRGEIRERLETPANFTFQTLKRPVDLELCVADQVSKMADPAAFHDGPDREVVIASNGKVIAAIELNGSASGTTVVGHIFAHGWDDRMRDRISGCL